MHILTFNAAWMTWNLFLALVGILLSWAILKAQKVSTKTLLFILWLLFVPNTIYILTDTPHIFDQWDYVTGAITKFILLSQYVVFIPLGIITFFVSMYLFEKGFKRAFAHYKNKLALTKYLTFSHFIVFINFLIAFGVVLGRTQRTNSWEIVTNTYSAMQDILRVTNSSSLRVATIIVGIGANLLYFSIKRIFFRTSNGR